MSASGHPSQPWSDLVAGYVTAYDPRERVLDLRTSADEPVRVHLSEPIQAELVRNLEEPYIDASAHLESLLLPGCHVFVYGICYPEPGTVQFDAKRLVFSGRRPGDYVFEEQGWWAGQLDRIAAFYRAAQFGGRPIDYRDYRTVLRLSGHKTDHFVQETDTISRLVYGMAAAYMLTGVDDYLDAAERGTEYLREHMRFVDRDNDVVYWYHGIDVRGEHERKLFTSEFGDDYDAIPMYEQIYALVGPTMTYRATGDPLILRDIDATLALFDRFFHDDERGGWFSHIDPILLSPHHDSLGPNASRKNWNSIGDHAPAYLINLYLATGRREHLDTLREAFGLIMDHFPDPDGNPFVRERFHGDFTPDAGWGWQQDRAVIGHNLKIAWNLMRMDALEPEERYRALARDIGRRMPPVGSDTRRGGWYDVAERALRPGQRHHRFVWHDRKAWWQQEQAILAYLVLAGGGTDGLDAAGPDPSGLNPDGAAEFLRHAREAQAFYNAFFLDHDEGGVYFNVTATGLPYLLGNERLKGSHSMSMYHASELCFLATVYGRLLLHDQPLTLWFRPQPQGFGGERLLRVAPDALPPGRVRLEWVEIDGDPYPAFDPVAMTVKLPDSRERLTVRAHLAAVGGRPGRPAGSEPASAQGRT
jgi:hypothetical protein